MTPAVIFTDGLESGCQTVLPVDLPTDTPAATQIIEELFILKNLSNIGPSQQVEEVKQPFKEATFFGGLPKCEAKNGKVDGFAPVLHHQQTHRLSAIAGALNILGTA